jgi:hypothetical protein
LRSIGAYEIQKALTKMLRHILVAWRGLEPVSRMLSGYEREELTIAFKIKKPEQKCSG